MALTAVDKSLETADLSALWAEITARIRATVSTDSYDRWFREIELVELDEESLTLRVPNNIYQLWIETNFQGPFRSVILLTLGSARSVKYVFRDAAHAEPPAAEPGAPLKPGFDEPRPAASKV